MIATIAICSSIILGCFVVCAIAVSKSMQTVASANARLDKRAAELDQRDELLKAAQIRMTREHAEYGERVLGLNLRLSECDMQRREAVRQLRKMQRAAVVA